MELDQIIVCPRCKGKDWITIDRYRSIKVLRCLDCRRKYTVDFENKRIIRKDIFGKERRKIFRAHCPECGSYEWRTTEPGEKESVRDYLCVCGVWYRINFKTRKIKRGERK